MTEDNARCGNCKYFVFSDIKNIQQGECRRFPPEHFILSTPQGLSSVCGFPTTKSISNCGEYQQRTILAN